MKYNRFIKLALFLLVVVLCYFVDTGLGIVGSTFLLGMAATAGEPEGTQQVEDPPQKSVEEIAKEAASSEWNIKSKELGDKILKLEGSIEDIVQKASAPPAEFFDAANKDSEKVRDGNALIRALVFRDPSLLSAGRHKDFLNETTNNLGGYLVPPEYNNQILDIMTSFSTISRNATIYNMARKELKIQKGSTYPSWAFLDAEGGEKSIGAMTFGQTNLLRKDGGFIIILSKSLLEDEAFDLMGYVNKIAGLAYANGIENAGYNGNVTPEIIGLMNNANGTTVATIDGTAFGSLIYENLITTPDAVASQFTANAKWFMHRTVWSLIKTLKKDNGDFVLSSEERTNRMIEGYPVELSDYSPAMSASAVSKKFITFGDLSQAMAIGQRQAFSVDFSKDATVNIGGSQTNLWQRGLVGLNFSGSFDIKLPFPEILVSLKTKAS